MLRRLKHLIGPLVGLAVFALLIGVLYKELKHVDLAKVKAQVAGLPSWRLAVALALTALAYVVVTGYDILGMRYIGQKISVGRVMFASFCSFVFSNNVGLSVVGASAVRLRMYTPWGLSAVDIAKLVVFTAVSFWLGILTLAGGTFIFFNVEIPEKIRPFIPLVTSLQPLGFVLLGLVAGYVVLCRVFHKPVVFKSWRFELPRVPIALAQPVVGVLDWALAAGTLFVVIPQPHNLHVALFFPAFLLAQVIALISHVPGGLLVFESVLLAMVGNAVPKESLLGALFLYRIIYYLLPLLVGALMMGGYELRVRKQFIEHLGTTYDRWVGPLVPHVFAFCAFVGGVLLLFSGAKEGVQERVQMMTEFVPLPFVELSHFLASVIGVFLLVLARGLQRRLDAAYWLTLILLALGVLLSLIKGFDYQEAIALGSMALALAPCHSQFYRRAKLFSANISMEWVSYISIVLLGTVALGVFLHKNEGYRDESWWQFGLSSEAPRYLRASVGAVIALLAVAVYRLIRPVRLHPEQPSEADMRAVERIVALSPRTSSHLALLGDKHFLFSDSRTAFIMYGVKGRSLIVMGDPVGPQDQWPDLLWQFREMCDRRAFNCVFYQVDNRHLPLYLDLGMTLQKLGDEARVELASFVMEGSSRKELRSAVKKCEQAGCVFEVLEPAQTAAAIAELRQVSDSWLTDKNGKEKAFSLGFFDEAYIGRFPAAVVRQQGRIVAFANLWCGGDKRELSVDLMRHTPQAPQQVMRYLFTQLMLWGKAQGYEKFNLGMAPLSGMEYRKLAPLWSKAGSWIFRHSAHFYSFEGLRRFKETFDPVWTPKYLASRGGLALPEILVELVGLISFPPERAPKAIQANA